ncbi:MAG: hypothetical protein E7458_00410 [Ruminococcaceae bacterium]|nr:hypothetical protein [Oscillospiraceae bacterium]
MQVYSEKLRHILQRYWPVLLVAAVGVLLLCWPSGEGETVQAAESPEPAAEASGETEARLSALLAQAAGVGRVEVMLTILQEAEYLYLEERTTSRDARGTESAVTETSLEESLRYPALRQEDGGEAPVLRTRRSPVYQGAVVVCDGADQASVRLTVINAVSALTGLSSDRITVMKMK